MKNTHRVMRESFDCLDGMNVHEGDCAQCDQWISDNEDEYPESEFYVERTGAPSFYAFETGEDE